MSGFKQPGPSPAGTTSPLPLTGPRRAVDTLGLDLGFAVRKIVRRPTFTVVLSLTLALGIGATTTIASLTGAVTARPLPVAEPERLMVLTTQRQRATPGGVSYENLEDLRGHLEGVASVAGYVFGAAGLDLGERAERIAVSYVSRHYFQVAGVRAAHGRLFEGLGVDRPGAAPEIVLTDGLVERLFAGDQAVVGRTVGINGQPFTVVGITPPDFSGTYALLAMDAFLPLGRIDPRYGQYRGLLDDRAVHGLRGLARLAPEIDPDTARAALDLAANRLATSFPDVNRGRTAALFREIDARPEPGAGTAVRGASTAFLGLALLVLTIASFDAMGMVAIRLARRRNELALRAALGAGRGRLVGQLTLETTLSAAFGAGLGILAAGLILAGLRRADLLGGLPLRLDLALDLRVLTISLVALVGSSALVGLVPATRAAGLALANGLRARAADRSESTARTVLVAAQVAAALTVLVVAGLLATSFGRARQADLGLDANGVLNVGLDTALAGHDEASGRAFFDRLEKRVDALPGVTSSAYAHAQPLGYYWLAARASREHPGSDNEEDLLATGYNAVGAGYFETLGIRVLAGRGFGAADREDSAPVAVINETLAKRFWTEPVDALGRQLFLTAADRPLTVVGVVGNGRYRSLFEEPRAFAYRPLAQDEHSLRVLHIRTTADPASLARGVSAAIRRLDPAMPVFDLEPMRTALDGPFGLFRLRWGARLTAVLGAAALALAALGVYGVAALAGVSRQREIGIRMALGASRFAIARLVVSEAARLLIVGLVAGGLLAAAAGRFLAALLYDTGPFDAGAFLGACALLGLALALACAGPVFRALAIAPAAVMRGD